VELWRDSGATQDEYGAAVESWTLYASRWAEIAPGRGAEKFEADAERASQTVTITIRYDETTATLTRKDRVRYTDGENQTHEYAIEAVSDRFTDHRYVELLCLYRSPEASRIP
jgi:SPP1 family predicted phage head-tail adaptor